MLNEKIYRVIVKDDFSPLDVNYNAPLDQLLSKSGVRTSNGFDQKVSGLNLEPKKDGIRKIVNSVILECLIQKGTVKRFV